MNRDIAGESASLDPTQDHDDNPQKNESPSIGRGGFVATLPHSGDGDIPVFEGTVSTKDALFSSAPIKAITGDLVEPVTAQAVSRKRARFGVTPLLAMSLAANVALLAACAHQQVLIAQNAPGNETVAAVEGVPVANPARPQSSIDKRWVSNETQEAEVKRSIIDVFRKRFESNKDQSRITARAVPQRVARDGASKTVSKSAPRGDAPPRSQLVEEQTINPSFKDKMRALASGERQEPVTIVHVGDSHVASDSFSRGIRRGLQAAYGDAGRGAVVPGNAFKHAVADGVRMTSAGPWSAANSLRAKEGPYGLSGVRVTSSSPRSSMTKTVHGDPFDWAEVTVLTGPRQGLVRVAAGGETKTVNARASETGSKVVRVKASGNTLKVTPGGQGRTTVLSWATGRETAGIRYVNFGIISATAHLTKRWDADLIANDVRHLSPDLIVFGFGTNEGFNDNLNLSSYRDRVQGFVDTVNVAAPNAEWLFLGPASGARRTGRSAYTCNGWRVPPKLGGVRDTLKDVAAQNDAMFWDWAEAMGGPCAVDQWARSSPKLAASDRVHLTPKGYQKSADALVAFLRRQIDQPQVVASARTQ